LASDNIVRTASREETAELSRPQENHERGRPTVTISVNGEELSVASCETLAELLERRHLPQQGVAVAINGELALRSEWSSTALTSGASIEIVTIAQGG
jgi:sulfur carrier protein